MDKIEITVKCNGKEVDPSTISDETLLAAKKNKLDYLKVVQATTAFGTIRIIFKVTPLIAEQVGKFIALDPKDGLIGAVRNRISDMDYYTNIRAIGEEL